jgi:hypothetical protein
MLYRGLLTLTWSLRTSWRFPSPRRLSLKPFSYMMWQVEEVIPSHMCRLKCIHYSSVILDSVVCTSRNITIFHTFYIANLQSYSRFLFDHKAWNIRTWYCVHTLLFIILSTAIIYRAINSAFPLSKFGWMLFIWETTPVEILHQSAFGEMLNVSWLWTLIL